MKVRTASTRSCPSGLLKTFFLKYVQNPDSGQNRDRKNPDRQISDSLFYKNTNRIRKERHWTAFFLKIRIESGQLKELKQTESGQTDTGRIKKADVGHQFPVNPDTKETSIGDGQCCLPTSVLFDRE